MKNGEGTWEEFVGSESVEVIGKVVCPIGNKFGDTEEMSRFGTSAGTVGGSPENVEEGGVELREELKWVAGGKTAVNWVENGL